MPAVWESTKKMQGLEKCVNCTGPLESSKSKKPREEPAKCVNCELQPITRLQQQRAAPSMTMPPSQQTAQMFATMRAGHEYFSATVPQFSNNAETRADSLKMLTWNIKSVRVNKHELGKMENRHEIDIIALQETHMVEGTAFFHWIITWSTQTRNKHPRRRYCYSYQEATGPQRAANAKKPAKHRGNLHRSDAEQAVETTSGFSVCTETGQTREPRLALAKFPTWNNRTWNLNERKLTGFVENTPRTAIEGPMEHSFYDGRMLSEGLEIIMTRNSDLPMVHNPRGILGP